MKLMEHLREKWGASEDWSEMCDLQYQVSDLPDGPDRDRACRRMADLLESYAARRDRSGLVRAMGPGLSSGELRAEAAVYREGRDPHA